MIAAACAKDERKPAAAADEGEKLVQVFEEMAALAQAKPTCAQWADEQARRFGADALAKMNAHMASMDAAAQQRFLETYGARVRAANELVQPIAERCVEELRKAAVGTVAIKPGTPPAPAGPPCAALRITLRKDALIHDRGDGAAFTFPAGALDVAQLEGALQVRAARCKGELVIAPADDVAYADVITVMDFATKHGFQPIGLDTPGAAAPATPGAAPGAAPPAIPAGGRQPGSDALQKGVVAVVTPTAITIGGKAIDPAAADLEAQVVAACQAALVAGATPGLFILQADAKTPARTVKSIIAAAKRAGLNDVLFAVKKA